MNESKFRKRTEQEARDRMEARRSEKIEMRRKLAGRLLWPADRGTFNEGRNQAKRERRAVYYGQRWINPRAMVARPTKAVEPAYRVRLPIVKRGKVLTHAPRSRVGSTTPMWIKRARNRRRDSLRRAAI